jgi:hypothetical protein
MLGVIYAGGNLCWGTFMLSVTDKSFLLSAIMLSVVVLSVEVPCEGKCYITFFGRNCLIFPSSSSVCY